MYSRFVVGAGVKVVQRSSQVYTKEEKGKKGKREGKCMGGEGDEVSDRPLDGSGGLETGVNPNQSGKGAVPGR